MDKYEYPPDYQPGLGFAGSIFFFAGMALFCLLMAMPIYFFIKLILG